MTFAFADCPLCGWECEFESVRVDGAELFKCGDCQSLFEIDEDADYDGDHYVDCSTPGKLVKRAWNWTSMKRLIYKHRETLIVLTVVAIAINLFFIIKGAL